MKHTLMLLLSCLLVVIYAFDQDIKDEIIEKKAAAAQKCVSLIGTDEDDIADVLELKQVTNNQTSCLIACMLKEFDLLKDGKMNKQSYIKYLEPHREDDPILHKSLIQIVETCDTETKDELKGDCEMAALILDCISKHAAKMNVDLDIFAD